MTRPFTLVCMASAFAAGLYLYQCKHAAQLLDRDIARTVKQAEGTRERTGLLRAEWALLNEPDRLAELARAHLPLQTLKPTQFAAAADLAARLPGPAAPRREPLVEPAPDDAPAPVPVAQAAPPKPRPDPKPETKAVAEAKPAAKPAVADKPNKPEPTERLAKAEPPLVVPAHPRPFAPPAPIANANADATGPGTVGAAVLRAMRMQTAAYAPAEPAPVRAYVPAPLVQPVPAASYAPAVSVLGGRAALPPPVPFAAR